MKHTELAELILDESGYTAMWQDDKSPQAQSRLENLKELVRFMHEFETLQGFLEHVIARHGCRPGRRRRTRVADDAARRQGPGVRGRCSCPAGRKGLFPHQRSLDESGKAGLEEERRLAYVGLTRAKRRAKISFAQNRRNRGLYQSALPSRFVDELPEAHVEVRGGKSPFGGAYRNLANGFNNPYGASRFDREPQNTFGGSSYQTPGWKRAQGATKPSCARRRLIATPSAAGRQPRLAAPRGGRSRSRASCWPHRRRRRRTRPASAFSIKSSATAELSTWKATS